MRFRLPSFLDRRRNAGASNESGATVVFAANWLPQYRIGFHEGLRASLGARGVRYELSTAQPERRFRGRRDQLELAWATQRRRRFLEFRSLEVIIDPIVSRRRADLVIVELQAKILTIPLQLLLAAARIGPRVMFFGHGSVDRTPSTGMARLYKQKVASAASGWLVYTERGADDLVDFGVDRDRIAVINNTTDVPELLSSGNRDRDTAALPRELELGPGPVLLHIGGLEATKRLDLVFEVFDAVQADHPDTQLVVAGAGPLADTCAAWAGTRANAHYLGPQFGEAKAALFHRADLLLHPGKLGLVVIDSFAAGLPIVGANGQMQAPEFDYLDDDVAFLADTPDVKKLSEVLQTALTDRDLRQATAAAARSRYDDYPMSEMVRRATDGIVSALDA